MNVTKHIGLCYHYIRPPKGEDQFYKLLGTKENEFREHIEALKQDYYILSPEEVHSFTQRKKVESEKERERGIFFSFDDGLSDHYRAAKILDEYNIQAFFFLPTCIFEDNEPINPVIIHYALSILTIAEFLRSLYSLPSARLLPAPPITYRRDRDDPWDTIKKIKRVFKYEMASSDSRMVLLELYRSMLLPWYPDLLTRMHLRKEEVMEMLSMGHTIGVHTKTHVSIAHERGRGMIYLLKEELLAPKRYLEEVFNTRVFALSYPFGEPKDTLTAKELLSATNEYELAFTVEHKANTKDTSPLELGRYELLSTDTALILKRTIDGIFEGKVGGFHTHLSAEVPE